VDAPILPCLGTLLAEAGVVLSDFWVFSGCQTTMCLSPPLTIGC
jgi:hypothetical protein